MVPPSRASVRRFLLIDHDTIPSRHLCHAAHGLTYILAASDYQMTTNQNALAEVLIDVGALTASAKADAISAMIQGRSDAPYLEQTGGINGEVSFETSADADLSDEEAYEIAKGNASRDADFESEARDLNSKAAALQARLAEVVYDRATGKPQPVLTGGPRVVIEKQLRQIAAAMKIAVFSGIEAKKFRAEQAALTERQVSEDALIHAWTGNDPVRVAALNAALLDIEARELAQKIHALRRS